MGGHLSSSLSTAEGITRHDSRSAKAHEATCSGDTYRDITSCRPYNGHFREVPAAPLHHVNRKT